MAATGYTPISLYYSTTAAAVPTNTNLVNGELAINITDGKLYYKDNTGTVKLLASNAATTNVASISFGTTGLTPSTATTGAVTVAGTLAIANGGTGQTTANAAFNALAPSQTGNNGKYLTTDGTNTSWATNPLGTVTSVDVSGGTTGLTTSGGPITTSGTITLAGTLAVTNGGTGLTSLTAGYIPFGAGTSAFGNSANLFWDNTNARLGIGTASPSVSGIEISKATGTATPTPAEIRLSTTSDASDWSTTSPWARISFYSSDASGGGPKVQATIGTVAAVASGNYASIVFSSTGNTSTLVERMRIEPVNGDVGINTTTPGANTLTVQGKSVLVRNDTDYLKFNNAADTTYYGRISQNSSDIEFSNRQAGALKFLTSDIERMRIDSSGNVGIGTSSPNAKLEVAGTTSSVIAKTTSTTGASYFTNLSTGGNFYVGIDNSAGSTFGGGAYYRNIYSDGAYPLLFWTNSTERMRLDSSGNLGLGVTPSAWKSSAKAIQVGSAGTFFSNGTSSSEIGANWYLDASAAAIRINADYATRYSQSSGVHAWYTAASSTAGSSVSFTQAMTLDASGNLGIANTSPSSTAAGQNNLVIGDGVATGSGGNRGLTIFTSASSAGTIAFAKGTTTSDNYRGYIQYGQSSFSGQTDAMAFATAAAERMRIDSSGNVGIGTASPAADLEVKRTGAVNVKAQITSAYESALWLVNGGGSEVSVINAGGSNVMSLRTNNTERMRIDSSGNVGIGTSSPSTKLHVNTTSADCEIRASATTSGVSNFNAIGYSTSTNLAASGGGATIYLQNKDTTANTYNAIESIDGGGQTTNKISFVNASDANNEGYMVFQTRPSGGSITERMRIDSSGNVGIGQTPSTTQGEKLQVAGSIAALNNTGLNAFVMNSAGSNWGVISNPSSDTWALGYTNSSTPGTTLGTSVLTWNASGNVTFSNAVRATISTPNTLSFDMNTASNFKSTISAGGALTFTNITAGQTGNIILVNGSNYAITAAATTKVSSTCLATISATGTYWLSYYSDGTNVYVANTGALA